MMQFKKIYLTTANMKKGIKYLMMNLKHICSKLIVSGVFGSRPIPK
jgi:hypothetical protein